MIRHFLLGFIQVHILHLAVREPFYGLWLIEELGRSGYKLSPGTLYPVLHAMEKRNLLMTTKTVVGGKVRKYYSATPKGRKTLEQTVTKIKKLLADVLGEEKSAR